MSYMSALRPASCIAGEDRMALYIRTNSYKDLYELSSNTNV